MERRSFEIRRRCATVRNSPFGCSSEPLPDRRDETVPIARVEGSRQPQRLHASETFRITQERTLLAENETLWWKHLGPTETTTHQSLGHKIPRWRVNFEKKRDGQARVRAMAKRNSMQNLEDIISERSGYRLNSH